MRDKGWEWMSFRNFLLLQELDAKLTFAKNIIVTAYSSTQVIKRTYNLEILVQILHWSRSTIIVKLLTQNLTWRPLYLWIIMIQGLSIILYLAWIPNIISLFVWCFSEIVNLSVKNTVTEVQQYVLYSLEKPDEIFASVGSVCIICTMFSTL
jgi:hypothetical protein